MTTPSPALIVAHPGHELRLHRWVEAVQPTVFVLTDGSGVTGHSRIEASRRLVERLGARPGSVFGPVTDLAVYASLLSGDVVAMTEITLRLGNALVDLECDLVVADGWEGYNSTHDVCRVVADLAVETAMRITGRRIRCFSYPVVAPAPSFAAPDDIAVPLDDAAWERKLASAFAYAELRDEANALLASHGDAPMRAEVLCAWNGIPDVPVLSEKPWYETRGEERVADGRYSSVIRYEQHVAPFMRALITSVRSAVSRDSVFSAR